jgi:PAS domain S-box-containing protein
MKQTSTPAGTPRQTAPDASAAPAAPLTAPSPGGVSHEPTAEAALRSSEARYRTLVEATAAIVWNTPASGELTADQPGWRAFTGQTEEELRGWGWLDAIHPDDRAATAAAWRRAVETRSTYAVEHRLRRADGEYRHMAVRGVPILDANGNVAEWVGVHTDVTRQKTVEAERERLLRAVAADRERLADLFREAPAFIATLRGPAHVFELANPRYLQLVGHRDVVGRTVAEALPEVVEQGFVDLLDGVYRSGEPFVGSEVRILLQREVDGSPEEVYVNFVYQPLRDIDGAVSGIFVHGVEVTDQVRARQEAERAAAELAELAGALERSNRELDQFAYVASHDLKAPLRGIANLSQWIEDDLADRITDEGRGHLELLRGRVRRMEALIEGILTYSRAGRARAAPDTVDTGALVSEIVDLLAPPPEMEIRVGAELPVLVTERLPLHQVLLNLVGNAVKYTRVERPRVEVSARRLEGGAWEFTVADNGVGIAPEYHDRIFGIFQTLHARDDVEGTGIGLSLVKKVVETRGGRVWVESREGEGATFRFTWPPEARIRETP